MKYADSSQPLNNNLLLTQSNILYRATFTKVIGISILLSVIAFFPRILDFLQGKDPYKVIPSVNSNNWILLIYICCLLLFITILERVEFTIERRRDRLKKDFVLSLRKFPYVFLAAIVQTAFFILLSIAFVGFYLLLAKFNLIYTKNPVAIMLITIPIFMQLIIAIYVTFSIWFYIPLIVTENFGVLQSLIYSFQLVWTNWRRTFTLQITPWLCYIVLLILLRYGANINLHVYYSPAESTSLFALVVHILIFALFIPWFASVMLVQLHDLELRLALRNTPRHTEPKKKISKKAK